MGRYLDIGGTRYLLEQLHDIMEKMLVGDVDLSDYVTKTELQKILDELNIDIDLSNYVTKEELEYALANIDTSDIDLSAYATKEYVTDAINNAELGGGGSSVDLSEYAKKTDLDAKADEEHTHTMSDITDYVAPTIPSLDGYATEDYVDNAIANLPASDGGSVDLSNYYTKDETYSIDETDAMIERNLNKTPYDVYLEGRVYRYAPINETAIYGEDGLYTATVIEDAEVGSYNKYELSDEYIRCDYSALQSMLNAVVNDGYNYTTMVWYIRFNGKNEKYSLNKEDLANDEGFYPVGLVYHNEPCVDLAYCGTFSASTGGSEAYPSYKKGDYFYRFVKVSLYDEEILENYGVWTPYFAYVTDDKGTVKYQKIEEVYIKDNKGFYTPVSALKTVSEENAKPTCLPSIQGYNTQVTYRTQLFEVYKNLLFYLNNPYLTKEEWLETLKGADGTVTFDELTDEQKASLKGEKGDKGDTGKDGTDGRGILSTTYEYGSSGNTATKPTEWYTTVGEVPTNYYRWTKQTVLYTDETSDIGYFVTKVVDSSEGDYATKEELVNYYTKSEVDTLIPNVSDGEDGTDGITPHIDEITKHWFIGETDTGVLAEGVNGVDGKDGTNGVDGTNGQDGADGYTPVRGTDYWTEQDIQTIKDYIDTELGVIENGSY